MTGKIRFIEVYEMNRWLLPYLLASALVLTGCGTPVNPEIKDVSSVNKARIPKDANAIALNHSPTDSADVLVEQMRGISMQLPGGPNRPTLESRRRDRIYEGFKGFGTKSVPPLASALADPSVEMRRNAALVLTFLNAPWGMKPRVDTTEAIPALIQAMGDSDPKVRAWAAHAIASMGASGAPAVPALIKLLADPHEGPRNNSAMALREIGALAEPALPALRKNLQDPKENPRRFARSAITAIEAAVKRAEPPQKNTQQSHREQQVTAARTRMTLAPHV